MKKDTRTLPLFPSREDGLRLKAAFLEELLRLAEQIRRAESNREEVRI